ncbi:solute carrier family 35 member G1-like [Brevipalpus obovatus]|uniref:solute carrier family 35 member G1-like n=1 Tax=Brevipalpus obovatus TaxID=246614 RepID=UPI003D9DB2EF
MVPIFTFIFTRIFFKEPCGIFRVIALAIALIGIPLTAKLDAFLGQDHDSGSQILGIFCDLDAALCQSTTALIVRNLKKVYFAVILFICSWVAVVENFIIIAYFIGALHVPERGLSVLLVMVVGVFGYFGQMLLTEALSIEEAGLIVMAQRSMDLFLAFFFQITIFQVIPDTCTVIGSMMVFAAVLLTTLRKYLITLPEDHHLRYYLAFILK